MLSAVTVLLLGLCAASKSKEHRLRLLKESWTHSNYSSFDHFWETEWGTDDLRPMTTVMKLIEEQRIECKLAGKCPIPMPDIIGAKVDCTNGNAGGYECEGIDLLSFVSLNSLGSGNNADGNDIWGYTASDGKHYAITGQTDGCSIVDVTDPENPVVLVFIQSQLTQNVVWRDMKVYLNYLYIVADRSAHGLQYVDMDELIRDARAGTDRPMRVLRGDGRIGRNAGVSNSHNIVLNEDSGYAYCVGSSLNSGGFGTFDLATPSDPRYDSVRSYSGDGYSHDAECVTYRGPDTSYNGREICFGYNENSLTIVDIVTQSIVSRTTYTQSAYTHQGWLTEDHQYLLMNDELDEQRFGMNTRTLIWDVRSLSSPTLIGTYLGPTSAIDHNLYIRGNFAYEANYQAGLRVLDLSNIADADLTQTAYFKTYQGTTITASFNGAWSVYPYFDYSDETGQVVVVQDIEQGLFVLRVNDVSNDADVVA